MIKKSVSLITAISFVLFSVCPVRAAESEKETQYDRGIHELGDEGWEIADVRRVSGTRIVLSPRVGSQIDLEESNRYALFQGATIYTQKIDLPILHMGVAGFQFAEFIKRDNGKLAIKIQYRSGPRIETQLMNVQSENDLRRLREYIEHFDEIVKGEYTLTDSSKIDETYPQYTEDDISFEERRVRFRVQTRFPGMVTLKNGQQIKGEFLPAYEDNNILIETDLRVQKVTVDEIHKVHFFGERGSVAMERAIIQGIGGAAMGALTGALAAWQANADVKETTIWAAAIFGIFGFVSGLVTGARATQSGKTFTLGPVDGGKRR
ncbi:MAG: hypothetical protein OXH16_00630 [Gemmatimonadetes bacterium]|nr:hypothetical protein [Gemmatimonadota bacterium]